MKLLMFIPGHFNIIHVGSMSNQSVECNCLCSSILHLQEDVSVMVLAPTCCDTGKAVGMVDAEIAAGWGTVFEGMCGIMDKPT